MKKRSFLSLLASAPLLGLFKAEEPLWWNGTSGPTVMTVEKLQELSRWMQKKRIKPFKLPNGKEYYVWCVEPKRYHRHFIKS